VKMKIRLLADPYCVGDCNSLPEPWGSCSAGGAVCLCVCAVPRVLVCKYQQERVAQVPQCMSQKPSHQPVLIQPSRDVFLCLALYVCV